MTISKEQLKAVYKEAKDSNIDKFIQPLNLTIDRFAINTPQRICMFLAQIGHESGQLHYVEELASGEAYEGRIDLGNTEAGDGVRYKGRGLIQITGKRNYVLCGLALDLPLLETPDLLKLPQNAASSAGWFWNNNNLNSLCDNGLFERLTKKINGGYHGMINRTMLYERAKKVFT